jgi:ADP-ribose diphosphatase
MSKQVYEGKHILVLERDGWEYVERKSSTEAVAVVAVTGEDEVILTEQYRRAVDARVIDWPAGLVGDEGDDGPAATAKKELEEETGFRCERVERLARGPSSPGITSEIVTFYRAYGVTRVGEGGGVGGEKITVHVVPRAEIVRWLCEREREGVLIDLKLWSGLHFVTASA